MKKVLLSIVFLASLISCKDEKKEVKNTEQEAVVEEKKEPAIVLPDNVVQLNKDKYVANGITLTKVQVQDSKNDNYIFKIFFEADNIKIFQNGSYSFFIQNFPYENDINGLAENFQKTGVASYWVNLKSAKPYKDGYVVFISFKSELYTFQKTVIGIMNLKTKADVFRVQYDDTIIIN